MIGSGKAHGGLYLLESGRFLSTEPETGQALQTDNTHASEQLLQWHRQLGHPSFGLMQKLFPSLFRQRNNHNFACDVCEFAKHRRVSYPSSL